MVVPRGDEERSNRGVWSCLTDSSVNRETRPLLYAAAERRVDSDCRRRICGHICGANSECSSPTLQAFRDAEQRKQRSVSLRLKVISTPARSPGIGESDWCPLRPRGSQGTPAAQRGELTDHQAPESTVGQPMA
eukprot:6328753-Pyramimonas_sp.AAC.1